MVSSKPLVRDEINKDTIDKRYVLIMQAMLENNTFKRHLFLKEISSWPNPKRRQLLRRIFQTLLGGSTDIYNKQSREIILKQYPDITLWSMNNHLLAGKYLDVFVNDIQSLEEKGYFEMTKVYTMSKLSGHVLSYTPETLEYLFSSGLVVLGEKLSVTRSAINPLASTLHPASRMVYRSDPQHARRIKSYYNFLADTGINTKIFFDNYKSILTFGVRIEKNISFFSDLINGSGMATTIKKRVYRDLDSIASLSQSMQCPNPFDGYKDRGMGFDYMDKYIPIPIEGYTHMQHEEFCEQVLTTQKLYNRLRTKLIDLINDSPSKRRIAIELTFDPFTATI